MASGVQVSDVVKHIHNEMKVVHSTSDPNKRIRLASFVIENGELIKEKIIREECLHCKGKQKPHDHDHDDDDDEEEYCFKRFLKLLESKKCRFILYDCHYVMDGCAKEDLLSIMWCPDDASIKNKMHYASSKKCVSKVFEGCKKDLTINDLECMYERGFLEQFLGLRHVTSIEGKDLCADH